MRRLWPPTYDDFSVCIWALSLPIVLVAFAILWFRLGGAPEALWWFWFPGGFVFIPIAGGGIEEVGGWRAWCGLVAWVMTNFVFYWFVARYFISAFQPVKSWWPEKRS